MFKLTLITGLIFMQAAFAGTVQIRSDGDARLYWLAGDRIARGDCPRYLDFQGVPLAELTKRCSQDLQTLHSDFFDAELDQTGPRFFNSSLILSDEALRAAIEERDALEKYRQEHGDDSISMPRLNALNAKIANHFKESEKKKVFLSTTDALRAKIKDGLVHVVDPGENENVVLSALKIPYDSYAVKNCGLEGAFETRLSDCARYNSTTKQDLVLISRQVGWPDKYSPVVVFKETWFSASTGHFWEALLPGIHVSPDHLQGIVKELWREPTDAEREHVQDLFPGRNLLINGAPLNLDGVKAFASEVRLRGSDKKILMEYAEGIVKFSLVENDIKMSIKTLSLPKTPKRFKGFEKDNDPYPPIYLAAAALEVYAIIGEVSLQVFEMSIVMFFPVTLGFWAAWTPFFLASVPVDLLIHAGDRAFDRDYRAYRKLRRMLRGKSSTVNHVVFEALKKKIQSIEM